MYWLQPAPDAMPSSRVRWAGTPILANIYLAMLAEDVHRTFPGDPILRAGLLELVAGTAWKIKAALDKGIPPPKPTPTPLATPVAAQDKDDQAPSRELSEKELMVIIPRLLELDNGKRSMPSHMQVFKLYVLARLSSTSPYARSQKWAEATIRKRKRAIEEKILAPDRQQAHPRQDLWKPGRVRQRPAPGRSRPQTRLSRLPRRRRLTLRIASVSRSCRHDADTHLRSPPANRPTPRPSPALRIGAAKFQDHAATGLPWVPRSTHMSARKKTRSWAVRMTARMYAHELAEQIPTSEERIRRIEYGKSLPTEDEARAIEAALGREPGSLFAPDEITPKRWHRPVTGGAQ